MATPSGGELQHIAMTSALPPKTVHLNQWKTGVLPIPAVLPITLARELHDKYVRLGERMEALVKEGKVIRSSASAEAGAARTAVQVRWQAGVGVILAAGEACASQ